MTCVYRIINATNVSGIGGHGAKFKSATCKVKQSDLNAKLTICTFETTLGLSSMLSDSCHFSNTNEDKCPCKKSS
jgi:hypothetical protein